MKRQRGGSASFDRTITMGVLLGLICTFAVSMILLCVISHLSIKGRLEESTANISVFVIRLASALSGVLVGSALIKNKVLIVSGIITVCYILLLASACVICYDSTFCGFGLGVVSVFLGGISGVVIRLKLQKNTIRLRKMKR